MGVNFMPYVRVRRFKPRCMISLTPQGDIDKSEATMEAMPDGNYVSYQDYLELKQELRNIKDERDQYMYTVAAVAVAVTLGVLALVTNLFI